MISVSSTAQMLEALRGARVVTFSAWFLRDGPIVRALEAAARRGAAVQVRVDGYRFGGSRAMAQATQAAIGALRKAGADARMVHRSDADGPDFHVKAAVCDGAAFLDDCNWNVAGDTVLRDDVPAHVRAVRQAASWHDVTAKGPLAFTKADALAAERGVLRYARGCREADVETEHLHASAVTSALRALAAKGVRCRVLVSARALADDAKTRAAARSLEKAGVDVRSVHSSEKFAVVDERRAWIGSADATSTFYDADEVDWSYARSDARLARTLAARFNAHWRQAAPV